MYGFRRDKEKLKLICEDYSQTGRFSLYGNQGNGTIRNAIATYCRYFEDLKINTEEIPQVDSSEPEEMTIEASSFAYERDLKNALIDEISSLFPGYKIFGNNLEGVEYRIEGKSIDILLEKDNQLKAIELKAGVANFKAFGQLAMYMGLLQNRFPDKLIHGVIIAGAIDDSLKYASITIEHVQLKTYQMKLLLEDA